MGATLSVRANGDGGAGACLDCLLAGGGPDQRQSLAREVSDVLARGLCESQLRDLLLYERGCCGAFERDGFDASGWLAHLRSRLLSSAILLLPFLVVCGCSAPPADDGAARDGSTRAAQTQEVVAYRACDFASPGEMVPLSRQVPADADPMTAAIREVVAGVNEEERTRGCSSFFSSETADAVDTVTRSDGDTLVVHFSDFSDQLPDRPGVKSFLPPGVMAELTWTIFDQFPKIEAVRFSFDGDEGAFWRWLSGDESDAEAFTREMWERV